MPNCAAYKKGAYHRITLCLPDNWFRVLQAAAAATDKQSVTAYVQGRIMSDPLVARLVAESGEKFIDLNRSWGGKRASRHRRKHRLVPYQPDVDKALYDEWGKPLDKEDG